MADFLSWSDELAAIAAEAAGDVGLLVALVALRKVEWGSAGREFGVLSVSAPTYAQQLHVAAFSLKHREATDRTARPDVLVRHADGFFTPDFLIGFSHQWAPIGAENDPHGMNAAHARNLVARAALYAEALRTAIGTLS